MDAFFIDRSTSALAGAQAVITTTSKLASDAVAGGKNLSEWESKWVDILSDFAVPQPHLHAARPTNRNLECL